MLPGIKNTIIDGALGVTGADATGRFAVVGVAETFGQGILTFTDRDQVSRTIGDGPLRDVLVSALAAANTTVYAVALQGSVPGVVSAMAAAAENVGTGTVTVTGSPRNDYKIAVELLSAGGLNEATFRVVVDGSPRKRTTVPAAPGAYPISGTGLTLTFSAGSFAMGDRFTCTATAPQASNAELLAGVDALIASKVQIEYIAIAGVSAAPLWAALAAKAEEAAEKNQYLFFVAQARGKTSAETVDQWVNLLAGGERGSTASGRLQVCAGRIVEADSNGQIDERGMLGPYCGMLASRKVHQGPDAVRYGAMQAATAIRPEGLNDGHIEALKNAGYVTVRQIYGMTGIYVTSGQMMAEAGSDYDLVERRRVMDKACREVRAAQFPWINDTVTLGVDGSPVGIQMIIAQSEQPLRAMVLNGEISAGQVVIPPGQNILATKKLLIKVRIVPLGKTSYIENEIAYSNPAVKGGQV